MANVKSCDPNASSKLFPVVKTSSGKTRELANTSSHDANNVLSTPTSAITNKLTATNRRPRSKPGSRHRLIPESPEPPELRARDELSDNLLISSQSVSEPDSAGRNFDTNRCNRSRINLMPGINHPEIPRDPVALDVDSGRKTGKKPDVALEGGGDSGYPNVAPTGCHYPFNQIVTPVWGHIRNGTEKKFFLV